MTQPAHHPKVLLSTSTVPRTTSLRRDDAMTGRNYSQAVALAGGLPVMVANLEPSLAEAYVGSVDALLLTGGGDMDPSIFGEAPDRDLGSVDPERDAFELALYAAFREAGKPVLGVCRGCQVINVAHGGGLHQHLPSVEGTHQHDQRDLRGFPSHPVELVAGSRLAAAYGATRVATNSYHHQAISTVGAGLTSVARSGDGIVEAVESTTGPLVVGVQWHPEMMFATYPEHLAPFRVLVEAATKVTAGV
ncbi:MAG TPA: gamma-glutamyl-gamma-aminobutyrate hydrolase family protein [Trueperaceae bacterium]